MGNLHVIDHPLVQHKLTLMRQKDLSTKGFRQLLIEISMLMSYEVLRDIPVHDIDVETPLESTTGAVIDGKKLVFVSILRAGSGILDGMLSVMPNARVGHIGLYRDPKTRVAVEYYFKLPSDLEERDVVVVDPMLATGNSSRRGDRPHQGVRPPLHQVRLPADMPRRRRGDARGAPGRSHLRCGTGSGTRRAGLHRARRRRCR